MQELRITIEDETLDAYRRYAERHGLPLDEVVRRVLARGVSPAQQDWLEQCFRLMDQAKAGSAGERWRREELYDV